MPGPQMTGEWRLLSLSVSHGVGRPVGGGDLNSCSANAGPCRNGILEDSCLREMVPQKKP